MLIESDVDRSGSLVLTAYSFDRAEFRAVEETLLEIGVQPIATASPPDSAGRMAQTYVVPQGSIGALGNRIGGVFSPAGTFQAAPGGPRRFACEQISLKGLAGRCKSIQAVDLAAARVACALLARNSGWFGGVPRPGNCP